MRWMASESSDGNLNDAPHAVEGKCRRHMGTMARQGQSAYQTRRHTAEWQKLCHAPFVPFVVFLPSLGLNHLLLIGLRFRHGLPRSENLRERDVGCGNTFYNVSCFKFRLLGTSVRFGTKMESANGCRRRSGGEIGQFVRDGLLEGGTGPWGWDPVGIGGKAGWKDGWKDNERWFFHVGMGASYRMQTLIMASWEFGWVQNTRHRRHGTRVLGRIRSLFD